MFQMMSVLLAVSDPRLKRKQHGPWLGSEMVVHLSWIWSGNMYTGKHKQSTCMDDKDDEDD